MADEQRFFFLNMIPAGVQGGSTKVGHVGWLEIDSWSFSMNQTAEPNSNGGQPKTTAASGRFGFTMKHAGPNIFKNVASGSFIPGPITFEAERGGVNVAAGTGAKTTTTYLRLVFSDLAITSRSLGGGDGQKTENIELTFTKVQYSYAQVINGAPQAMIVKSYDVKQNQTS
jgi:type VI protein secretion system component Hcp